MDNNIANEVVGQLKRIAEALEKQNIILLKLSGEVRSK